MRLVRWLRGLKSLCNFEPQIWPETITCFIKVQGRHVTILGIFWAKFLARKKNKSHHVKDASFRFLNVRGQTAEKITAVNTRKTVKTAVFWVFRLFARLFLGCLTGTHSAPFSAVFQLFSMSGIWHLCRWPQRLQELFNHETKIRNYPF